MSGDNPPAAVQPVLRAIAAAPRTDELEGFATPLAHYRAALAAKRPSTPRIWRPAMLSSLLGAKLGATIAGVAVGLGGAAAAVYVGSLPAGPQNPAHSTMGAPSALPAATATATKSSDKDDADEQGDGVGPDATGPAAFGLCNAWAHHQAHRGTTTAGPEGSVAFRNLAAAAGGAGKIAAYCATIPHPGNGARGATHGKAGQHATGKPTTKGKPAKPKPDKTKGAEDQDDQGRTAPAPTPTGHTTTTHPTTAPTSAPTTHPTTAPTTAPTSQPTTTATATATTTG